MALIYGVFHEKNWRLGLDLSSRAADRSHSWIIFFVLRKIRSPWWLHCIIGEDIMHVNVDHHLVTKKLFGAGQKLGNFSGPAWTQASETVPRPGEWGFVGCSVGSLSKYLTCTIEPKMTPEEIISGCQTEKQQYNTIYICRRRQRW